MGLVEHIKVKRMEQLWTLLFFSTQWNKPFSTGIGGIAVTKNEIIAQKLKEIEAKAVKPNLKEKIRRLLKKFHFLLK
jgi:dTDP-4-amino-4,6-dideoxygalactose transaminase